MLLVLVLTRASNARIQVPLISVPAAHDDDDDDEEEDDEEDDDDDDDEEEEEDVDDGRVEVVDVAELEKVKPLNLQSSFPASTNESNRSDFIRSNA